MGLKEDFDKAVEEVRGLKSLPANDDLLELYALFKQGTDGDCNTDRAGMLDIIERAKWDKWNSKKGMAKDAAMTAYIAKVQNLKDTIGMA